MNKDFPIGSGKALCCSACPGENDQLQAQVCVSNIPSEQDFSLQTSQIGEGGIPEMQPSEELSVQCSIWQVRSWNQPGHTGELLPVGSWAWLPIALAIQLSYSLLWLSCHQIRNPYCLSAVEMWFSPSLGVSVYLRYTTTVVTEHAAFFVLLLGTGAGMFSSYKRSLIHWHHLSCDFSVGFKAARLPVLLHTLEQSKPATLSYRDAIAVVFAELLNNVYVFPRQLV